MIEIWRSIPGFERSYEASNMGRIRSIDRVVIDSMGRCRHLRGKVFAASIGMRGYPVVTLSRQGYKQRTSTVHSLVAAAFLGPMPNGKEVAHADGNRANPRLDNLRYATSKENEADKVLHGTSSIGEKNPSAVLTEMQALEIISYLKSGERVCDLSRRFGASYDCIYDIKREKSWKHLKERC